MKRTLLALALTILAATSQAKTVCNINSQSQPTTTNSFYDRQVYTVELATPLYVLVAKDGSSAREIQLNQLDSYEKWKAVNGSILVSLGQTEQGYYGMTVGRIDISKKKNMLPLDAMAIGAVTEKQFLNLVVPKRNLSVTCFQQ